MWDTPEERARWRKDCEEKGEAWARANLENLNPAIRVHIREWLEERAQEASALRDLEQRRLAQDAIDAARDAATVAREAAMASEKSAKWTMIAALVALIGVVVQAITGS
jgi:predicted DNA-binding ribbon-helix-helix protein